MPQANVIHPKQSPRDFQEALRALIRLWLDASPNEEHDRRILDRFIGRVVRSASAGGGTDA